MVVWVYTLVFFNEFFEFVLTEYAHGYSRFELFSRNSAVFLLYSFLTQR